MQSSCPLLMYEILVLKLYKMYLTMCKMKDVWLASNSYTNDHTQIHHIWTKIKVRDDIGLDSGGGVEWLQWKWTEADRYKQG